MQNAPFVLSAISLILAVASYFSLPTLPVAVILQAIALILMTFHG